MDRQITYNFLIRNIIYLVVLFFVVILLITVNGITINFGSGSGWNGFFNGTWGSTRDDGQNLTMNLTNVGGNVYVNISSFYTVSLGVNSLVPFNLSFSAPYNYSTAEVNGSAIRYFLSMDETNIDPIIDKGTGIGWTNNGSGLGSRTDCVLSNCVRSTVEGTSQLDRNIVDDNGIELADLSFEFWIKNLNNGSASDYCDNTNNRCFLYTYSNATGATSGLDGATDGFEIVINNKTIEYTIKKDGSEVFRERANISVVTFNSDTIDTIWHHVYLEIGSLNDVYVDGNLVFNGTNTTTIPSGNYSIHRLFNDHIPNTDNWIGYIDEFILRSNKSGSNPYLTSKQIKDNFLRNSGRLTIQTSYSNTNNTNFTGYKNFTLTQNNANITYSARFIRVDVFMQTLNSSTTPYLQSFNITYGTANLAPRIINNYTIVNSIPKSSPTYGDSFSVVSENNGTEQNDIIIYTNFTIQASNGSIVLDRVNGTYIRNGNIFNWTSTSILIPNTTNSTGNWKWNYTVRENTSTTEVFQFGNFTVADTFNPFLSIINPINNSILTSSKDNCDDNITLDYERRDNLVDGIVATTFERVLAGISQQNRTLLNSENTTFTPAGCGSYIVILHTNDTYNNPIREQVTFTITKTTGGTGTGPAGGGGGGEPEEEETKPVSCIDSIKNKTRWSIETDTGSSGYNLKLLRDKNVILKSNLLTPTNIVFSCESESNVNELNLCNFVKFDKKNITLPITPQEFREMKFSFNLTEEQIINKILSFNIIADDESVCLLKLPVLLNVSKGGFFLKFIQNKDFNVGGLEFTLPIALITIFFIIFSGFIFWLVFNFIFKLRTALVISIPLAFISGVIFLFFI